MRTLTQTGTPLSSETFSLDPATNIASRTGPSASYSYDGANRVTSDGTRSLTFDGADRLVSRGSDSFSYDALSRLTGATITSASPAATSSLYIYDGDGLLRSRTASGSITGYLWDTSVGVAQLLQAGSERIVYGLGPLYRVHADASYDVLVRDALGSVRAEVSGTGTLTDAFDYTAYGEVRASLAGPPTLLGFAGELRDPTGLIYLRARWYDPAVGRFMSRDPFPGAVAAPSSLGRFTYGSGSPSMRLDPSGLWTGALCISANFSAGGYALYQFCPVVVASNGEIGWAETIGSGLSPSLAVSATGNLQVSNGNRIADIGGPFTQAGASAGEGVVGGSDWFWNDDRSVQGVSGSAGFGLRATGFAPVEIHVATTNTKTGVFFNVLDLFRSLFGPGANKRPAG